MKHLTVAARSPELETVLAFIEGELAAASCPPRARLQLALAAEEVFVNIVRYAYTQGGGDVLLTLSVSGVPPSATLTFADGGVPYNPLEKPDPDVTLPVEDRAVGGLGVYLVKQNVDEVRYHYADGRNVLTLIKAFQLPFRR